MKKWKHDSKKLSYTIHGINKKAIIKKQLMKETGDFKWVYYLTNDKAPFITYHDFSTGYDTAEQAHRAFKEDYERLPDFNLD